jgi:hypothetical protein
MTVERTRTSSEAWQRADINGIRVQPCMNADSVWVELLDEGRILAEMTPTAARDMAERFESAAANAELWKEFNR